MGYRITKAIVIFFMGLVGSAFAGGSTGEEFTFKPDPVGGAEMVWYLMDWGDGTLTPTSHGKATSSPPVPKVWRTPGHYVIKTRAITMSGKVSELKERSISVTGEKFAEFPEFLASKRSGNPPLSRDPYLPQSIALHFEQIESIDALLLKKDPKAPFPHSFGIEVSTDGGFVWNDVPAAVYNHFPDPGGQTVWIPLHGVVANAIRVISYNPPKVRGKTYALRLGGLRAVGCEMLFEMDADPQTVADWNNMWLIYGSAANEVSYNFFPWWPVDRPNEGGLLGIGSTIWAHWNAMKLSWIDDPFSKTYYEKTVNSYPQDEQGLMGVSGGGFLHLNHSKHYVTPAIFISGMSHWYLMHRDGAFLEMNDKKTGVSLLEKMRKAMRYQLEELDGKAGVLTIPDPTHDGTVNGMSGNYWDAWRFGYKSAYANMLFYQSLDWMERLETALGNLDEAEQYKSFRPLVKQRFNEVFWNEKKGRFIGCEGTDGSRHDYGFTFVNLEAVASGIATPEHAEQILQWLDGKRIVAGDTSTGADIYAWNVSPRANTLDAAAVNPSFWDSWTMEIGPGTMGEYGKQIQNGGHIFYVSYYDLMSRLQTRGIADAMKRMEVILDEFHKDHLRRKPSNKFGSTHLEGILREFPESGLVPLFFVTGILGIEPGADGLHIAPSLPDGWSFAAVNEYWFAGKKYRIRVERNLEKPTIDGQDITVPAHGRWILTLDGEFKNAD